MFLQSLQKSELNLRHVSATPAFLCLDSGEGFATPAMVSTGSQACFCHLCNGLFQIAQQRYNIQIAVFE
jgi:hypothetical protein